ncbi:MAG: hypothetical protein WC712_12240 [Candidatus Brocadiia bacterium]
MRRPPGLRHLFFAVSVFVSIVVFVAGVGIAETAAVKPTPKKTEDPASAMISKQRSYVYSRNTRDIFHDMFVAMTIPPSPSPKPSPMKSGTTPVSEDLLDKAKREVEVLLPVVTKYVRDREYDKAIAACRAVADKYKDLGKDLQTVMEPLLKLRKTAEDRKVMADNFKTLCAGMKISAILWSERNQSVIINGRIYYKGETIAADFPGAAKDLKIVEITPKSIMVSSAELDLRQEVVFDPLLEKSKGGEKK